MSSQWILGPKAAGRAGYLCRALLPLKLNQARGRGAGVDAYSPWLPLTSEPDGLRVHELSRDTRCRGISLVRSREYRALLACLLRGGSDERPLGRVTSIDIQSDVVVDLNGKGDELESLVAASADLALRAVPWLAELTDAIGFEVVPIVHYRDGVLWKRGFSHIDHLGVIFLSFLERHPFGAHARAEMAVDFAHEIGHQTMMIFQHSDAIVAGNPSTPVYSSVRRTLRPAIMAFHAAVAMAFMTEACQGVLALPDTTEAEKRYARESLDAFSRHQPQGLESLRETVRFTEVGRRMFSDLEAQSVSVFASAPVTRAAPELGA